MLPLPFFLPPEQLIHTHMPHEPCWQLLPEPLSLQQWWELPEVAMALFAAGGQLLAPQQLHACTVLSPAASCRRSGPQVLPCMRIAVTAPASERQHVAVKLLDSQGRLLSAWQHGSSPQQQQQPCLVYQQLLLHGDAARGVGSTQAQQPALPQELWVAFPEPGAFFVHVSARHSSMHVVAETQRPGGTLCLCCPPLALALRCQPTGCACRLNW